MCVRLRLSLCLCGNAVTFFSENVERKQTKEGKTWRTKIAHKFRPTGVPVSAMDTVDSVQPARVFGIALDKSVPSHSNEVPDCQLM